MSFQSRSLPRGVKLLLLQRWRAVKPPSRLLLVNTGTCCALYALGDVVQQKLTCKEEPIDAARTFRMAVLGACMGPLNHYWYVLLDRLLPGVSARIVLKKVVLDQLAMAPLCCSVFYFGELLKIIVASCILPHISHTAGMGVLEGRSWKHISREIEEKFWPTYVVCPYNECCCNALLSINNNNYYSYCTHT